MDKKTLKALKGSINTKWKGIRYKSKEDEGGDDCELCGLFMLEQTEWNKCKGCPVYERTSQILCKGTPYIDWSKHQHDVHGWDNAYVVHTGCGECKPLADKQIAFLESLLPRTTPRRRPGRALKGGTV